jgi:hypothetical protein
MPCYEVVTLSLDLKAASISRLTFVLNKMGFKTVKTTDGKLAFDGYYRENGRTTMFQGIIDRGRNKIILPSNVVELVDKIKQQYSKHTVIDAARKFGWKFNEKGNSITMEKKRVF